MKRSRLVLSFLVLPFIFAGCSAGVAPKANKALRPVPLTSSADVRAYDIADAVDDQLRAWCAEAFQVREAEGLLSADDPIVDGRAAQEVQRLRAAAETTDSAELATSLVAFALAHEQRLAVLVAGPKFAAKRYLRADRKIAELAFGLRRWRLQR